MMKNVFDLENRDLLTGGVGSFMTSDDKTESKKEYMRFKLPGEEDWQRIDIKDVEGTKLGSLKENQIKENKAVIQDFLLSSMQMQHVMVLAGSGTSLGDEADEVRGPSMGDLWKKTTDSKNISSEDLSSVRKKTKYLAEGDNANIEEFLSSCEAYLQIEKKDKNVQTFLSKAKKVILTLCSFEVSEEQLAAHINFLHRLSRRRSRDSRLKIFTTNYDLCFERAASELGLVAIDGFSFSNPRVYNPLYFDYDIVRRDNSSNNDASNYLDGVFQLYKLHGSVNWERRKENNKERICETTKAKPGAVCMIFPAKDKYQQSYIQPHLELMARYLSSLRTPNTCLIVCGFGFNDDHLSEPIISAIESNPHMRVIVVTIHAENDVEKGNSYWKKLEELAKQGEDVTFINASFKAFANLIPDLKTLSAPERLAEDLKTLLGAK